MKNMIFPAIILVCVMIVLLYFLLGVIKNSWEGINDVDQSYKDLIGVQVVYKEDTLMIVDYKLLEESLILDNGTQINVKLLESLPTIPKEE